jgi:hypothetical protein
MFVIVMLVALILMGWFVVKKTKQTLADLMIITGAMLVFGAIPFGIVFALQPNFGFRSDLHLWIIAALAMTIPTAIIGGIFIFLGEYIIKKRCMTIFIALLDESVSVWRPVSAIRIRDDVFQIRGKPPEGERWQFITGELVRCKEQTFADGQRGLVGQEKVSV